MQNPLSAFFRYRFFIGPDFQSAALAGSFNVDNAMSIYLNGTALADCVLGCPVDATALAQPYYPNDGRLWDFWGTVQTIEGRNNNQPLNINGDLQSGWNTLYIALTDVGSFSGINYDFTLTLNSAYPISVAAPGSIVTFDPQGGSVSTTSETVAPSQPLSSVTRPVPIRAGYTFDGWFTAQTGGQLVTSSYAATFTPTADFTLFARWTPITSPVFFDEQGGAAVADASFTTGGSAVALPVTTRPGYAFAGWFPTQSGGVVISTPYTPTSSAPVTLFAQWLPLSYGVMFEEQGGSLVTDLTFSSGGSPVTLPVTEREGYSFAGWTLFPSGGSRQPTLFTPPIASNVVLYAQWVPISASGSRLASAGVTTIAPIAFAAGLLVTGALVVVLVLRRRRKSD